MDRTNIIDTDEVTRAMALASQGKGKGRGKGKQKATESRTNSPSKPKKTDTVTTTRERAKTPASATPATTATPTQASEPRFYEANGLKIHLYNKDGLGNKKRQYARLSKTLLKYNTDQLLDIVEQYAGADKRRELKNKGLSKSRLANWIEEKETIAIGRNPKSNLAIAKDDEEEAESSDDVASFSTPTDPTSTGYKNTVTTPASNDQEDASPIAAKGNGTFDKRSRRKRRAPDRSLDGQPPAKLQKRDEPANLVVTRTGHSTKDTSTNRSVDDVIPTPPQTNGQTVVYNNRDNYEHRKNAFFRSTGMDPFDPDRSSMIVRGDGEDRVLTATSRRTFRGDEIYIYETAITHAATEPPHSPSVPYLKEGVHGRRGDFQADDDRRTGPGHQIEPDVQLKLDEFKNFRSRLYEQFPHYPHTAKGVSVDSETKGAWDQWQQWYAEFGDKYSGYAVCHLWPCGCEKVGDGDESEEE